MSTVVRRPLIKRKTPVKVGPNFRERKYISENISIISTSTALVKRSDPSTLKTCSSVGEASICDMIYFSDAPLSSMSGVSLSRPRLAQERHGCNGHCVRPYPNRRLHDWSKERGVVGRNLFRISLVLIKRRWVRSTNHPKGAWLAY